ncbi:MAG TPA: DUF1343 domain-containing protein [Gemmatimonadales bacterium]|nr:DUF1343 domain-containing protein [Gemmatimonadales bacterium]
MTWCTALGAGCGTAPAVAAPQQAEVQPGLEVLLTDSLALVSGRRVGLVANMASVDRQGVSAVDRFRTAGVNLTALFSPEHGFRGTAAPGERVASTVDSATGLPIYSLYGRTVAPTPEMLTGIDVLLVDLPDVGARYYTYISTTVEVMRAAGRAGIPVVVLDRPNPIGGRAQGNVLDSAFRSFVGMLSVPMRPGLTLAEQALLARAELGIDVDLRVVPAAHWTRTMALDDAGLPFLPPSPNLKDLESLFHYPGTCLFEGTSLSVGRGTSHPFHQVGAPWLDTTAVLALLRSEGLPGVRFVADTFTPVTPGDQKHAGVRVNGIRLVMMDRLSYDPTVTAVAMLVAIQSVHPEQIGFVAAQFDRLAGGATLREAIRSGQGHREIVAEWVAPLAAFERRRAAVLLYP